MPSFCSRIHSRSAAATLVISLAASLLGACGDDGGEPVDETTTSVAEPTTTRRTTTTVADDAPPSRAVALTTDGELVVIDIAGGEVSDTLARGLDVDDPAKNSVEVTPAGDTAFVALPAGDSSDVEIRRFDIDGGRQTGELVATGLAPAVSPDGRTLAYVHFTGGGPDPADQPVPTIVLRDLTTGEETVLERRDEQPFVFIADLAFTADGSGVAFIAGEVMTGLWVVDREAADLDGARRLGPESRGDDASWTAVTSFGADRLVVAERCCDIPPEREVVLLVNLDPLTVEGGLLPEESGAVDLDVSDDDRHLLYVAGRRLLRWTDGDAEVTEVLAGVVAGAW